MCVQGFPVIRPPHNFWITGSRNIAIQLPFHQHNCWLSCTTKCLLLLLFVYQDVWSAHCFMGEAKAGVMYFMWCRQYRSSVRFNLTTCSVVFMPHRALTASCNCRASFDRADWHKADSTHTAARHQLWKPPTLSTCLLGWADSKAPAVYQTKAQKSRRAVA